MQVIFFMSTPRDPFLLFFYAEGCESSASMTDVLRELQKHYGEKMPCIALNINSALARKHPVRVSTAPTVLLMRGNEELWRVTGLAHTSEIINAVEQALQN